MVIDVLLDWDFWHGVSVNFCTMSQDGIFRASVQNTDIPAFATNIISCLSWVSDPLGRAVLECFRGARDYKVRQLDNLFQLLMSRFSDCWVIETHQKVLLSAFAEYCQSLGNCCVLNHEHSIHVEIGGSFNRFPVLFYKTLAQHLACAKARNLCVILAVYKQYRGLPSRATFCHVK
jgi:hypothetical protein